MRIYWLLASGALSGGIIAQTYPRDEPGKVVARLEREGWVPRHGGDHDLLQAPFEPGSRRGRTPSNPVHRRGTRGREDCRLGRLREGNRDHGAIRGVDRR
jgi:hypothetical protein